MDRERLPQVNFEAQRELIEKADEVAAHFGKSRAEAIRWMIDYCYRTFVDRKKPGERSPHGTIAFEVEYGEQIKDAVTKMPALEISTKALRRRVDSMETDLEKVINLIRGEMSGEIIAQYKIPGWLEDD